MRRDYLRRATQRPVAVAVAVVVAAAATAGEASAQTKERVLAIPHIARPGSIRRSLDRLDYGSLVLEQAQPTSSKRRSVGRKILGGALGAAGGFFAGGYLGAWIDGECGGCDDPGLKGALIGAPIGAVVGGVLGAKFF
jgi:hypothetical protein